MNLSEFDRERILWAKNERKNDLIIEPTQRMDAINQCGAHSTIETINRTVEALSICKPM